MKKLFSKIIRTQTDIKGNVHKYSIEPYKT